MRKILITTLFFISCIIAMFGNDFTNGVFYIDTPIECHLISQNGAITTNQLVAGKSYLVGNVLLEMESTNQTTFYFSGGTMIDALPKFAFTIDSFEQEVKNLDAQPQKAAFGARNLNVTFSSGEYSIIYTNKDINSTFTVNTPYATYELSSGKYFFRVSQKSTIAFVMEGIMTIHGDKNRTDKTEKGKLSLAIPFTDPTSGVDDKILTSIKTLKQEENDRFAAPIILSEKKWSNVEFIVINGRVIGVLMKPLK